MAEALRANLDRELKKPGRGALMRAFKSHERALREYMQATRAVDDIVKNPDHEGLAESLAKAAPEDAAFAEEIARKIIDGREVDPEKTREIFARLPALERAFSGESGKELIEAFERQGRAIAAYRAATIALQRELGRPEFGKVARLLAELRTATELEISSAAAQRAE